MGAIVTALLIIFATLTAVSFALRRSPPTPKRLSATRAARHSSMPPAPAIILPSNKACVAGGKLTVQFNRPPDGPWATVNMYLNGKRLTTLRYPHVRRRMTITGLPRGRFIVTATAVTRARRTRAISRRYTACAARSNQDAAATESAARLNSYPVPTDSAASSYAHLTSGETTEDPAPADSAAPSYGYVTSGDPAPADSAAAPSYGYVTNSETNQVLVLDTSTNTVVGSPITVGAGPVGVAVSADGERVYVADSRENKVSIIDAETETVLDTVEVGSQPRYLAVTPDGKRVYVANTSSENMSVINTETAKVIKTIPIGTDPQRVAVTPNGEYVYVTDGYGDDVVVVSTATEEVAADIGDDGHIPTPNANFASDVVIPAHGGVAYVAYKEVLGSNGGEMAIDESTGDEDWFLGFGGNPYGITASPNGKRVYLGRLDGEISVTETATQKALPPIIAKAGSGYAMATSPDGKYVYSLSGEEIAVVNTETDSIEKYLNLGKGLGGIATRPPPPAEIVSVGDSYIVGEGGRWAGNTANNSEWSSIDALGEEAYYGEPNEEPSGEAIPLCHRSKSAEIFIGEEAKSKNLACSGARTFSFVDEPPGVWFRAISGKQNEFKPGLDFENKGKGKALLDSKDGVEGEGLRCPIEHCRGQALQLQEYAEERYEKTKSLGITMVVVSMGGNNFNFGPVGRRCIEDFPQMRTIYNETQVPRLCSDEQTNTENIDSSHLSHNETLMRKGIEHVEEAMEKAGYEPDDFTVLVQNYPSPIASEGEFRYGQDNARIYEGGCGLWDADAKWISEDVLPDINRAVEGAALGANSRFKNIKRLNLATAFEGRRLCQKGTKLVGSRGGPADWSEFGAVNTSEWVNQARVSVGDTGLLNIFIPDTPFYLQEDVHPNYWGQLALRNCIRQAYNEGEPKGGTCTKAGLGLVENEPGEPPEPDMVLGGPE